MSDFTRRGLLGAMGAGMMMTGIPLEAFAAHKRSGQVVTVFSPHQYGAKGDGRLSIRPLSTRP